MVVLFLSLDFGCDTVLVQFGFGGRVAFAVGVSSVPFSFLDYAWFG